MGALIQRFCAREHIQTMDACEDLTFRNLYFRHLSERLKNQIQQNQHGVRENYVQISLHMHVEHGANPG